MVILEPDLIFTVKLCSRACPNRAAAACSAGDFAAHVDLAFIVIHVLLEPNARSVACEGAPRNASNAPGRGLPLFNRGFGVGDQNNHHRPSVRPSRSSSRRLDPSVTPPKSEPPCPNTMASSLAARRLLSRAAAVRRFPVPFASAPAPAMAPRSFSADAGPPPPLPPPPPQPVVEPPTSEGAGASSSSTTAGAGGAHRSSPGAAAGARRQGGAGYEEEQEKVLRASLLHVVAIRIHSKSTSIFACLGT
jgi:hypothetical protein